MHLNAQCQYAVRAVLSLARHARERKPLPAEALARETGMPVNYVPQVMAVLRRAGLVEGQRGASGGYRLTRDPGVVSVGEVVRAVRGPHVSVDCLPGDACRARMEGCPLRRVWERVERAVSEVLEGASFQELAAACPRPPDYVI